MLISLGWVASVRRRGQQSVAGAAYAGAKQLMTSLSSEWTGAGEGCSMQATREMGSGRRRWRRRGKRGGETKRASMVKE